MTEQARTARVLIGLIASMTIGAVVLMALDTGPMKGGPWTLVGYIDRVPAHQVATDLRGARNAWKQIEVFYGNARELAILSDLIGSVDLNAHWVVWDGRSGNDGEIQRTEQWELQQPCLPDGPQRGTSDTIRICVVADGVRQVPTEMQEALTDKLVTMLRNEFGIGKRMVIWPANWRM